MVALPYWKRLTILLQAMWRTFRSRGAKSEPATTELPVMTILCVYSRTLSEEGMRHGQNMLDKELPDCVPVTIDAYFEENLAPDLAQRPEVIALVARAEDFDGVARFFEILSRMPDEYEPKIIICEEHQTHKEVVPASAEGVEKIKRPTIHDDDAVKIDITLNRSSRMTLN